MDKWECPFCHSKTPIIETPFLELDSKGNHVKKTQPCCRWQAANMRWQGQHVDNKNKEPLQDLKDIAKWKGSND